MHVLDTSHRYIEGLMSFVELDLCTGGLGK